MIADSISGKRIVITGASSGLGLAFAEALARQGAVVTLAARRKEVCLAAAEQIVDGGGNANAVELDITDPASVSGAFEHMAPFDALINNAGVGQYSNFVDMSEDEWSSIFETNVSGVWRCSKAAITRWVEDGTAGNIVNVASILGLRVTKQIGAYAASKAAVIQLTKSIALDHARYGIRCNALCPGFFETDINRDFLASDPGQALLKRIPQRRVGQVGELFGPLQLLLSDASSYMTGSVIAVDGGHVCAAI